jgi:alkanesulfonate monooxygenase
VTHIGTWPEEGPEPSLEHLAEIVTAAEDAGFTGLLVPATFRNHHDALLASAAVLARTRRAALNIAVRPFQYHPAQCAKMVATLADWFSDRIQLNIVGAGGDEPLMLGVRDDRAALQRRLAEWLEVFDEVLYGDLTYSHSGEFYDIENFMMVDRPRKKVPIYLSGSSDLARSLLFRYGDYYLMFGLPPDAARAEIDRIRSAPGFREEIKFCLRFHLVVRPTSDEAWAAAADLISRVDPRVSEIVRAERHHGESKLAAQHDLAAADELIVGPNLWAGVGTARRGAAIAIVGDPDEVTRRLVEYRDLGVDSLILSGYPKLREAHRFRELLVPRLQREGLI